MLGAHDGIVRKFSKKLYATHPISVANLVREYKTSKNMDVLVTSALLHDVVEDSDYTIEDIENKFGSFVASIVDELTSDDDKIKEMGKADYLLHKMNNMSSYALVIKLCDRLHNCSDLTIGSEKFRNKYIKETRYILDNLDRKMSQTHLRLIAEIYNKINLN